MPIVSKTQYLQSRSFWFGLLITAFWAWVLYDSFANFSALRTIHRGSLKDWSSSSQIPAGTPPESGSLVLKLGQGAMGMTWLDEIMPSASYSGGNERGPATGKGPTQWFPLLRDEKDSVFRIRSVILPTWIPLLGSLILWGCMVRRSVKRTRQRCSGA